MLEKVSKMSVRTAIITLAGNSYHPTKQSLWRAAARNSKGISYRMMKSLWNNEIKKEDHWAKRELRRLAELEAAQKEARDLASQFETIAGGLNAKDADFHSQDVAALVHAARILRGLDSA